MVKTFKNGHMTCMLVSLHTTSMTTFSNVAIVAILDNNCNINSYVVVNNLVIDDDNNGTWSFAYQYDIDSLTEASQIFIKKIS